MEKFLSHGQEVSSVLQSSKKIGNKVNRKKLEIDFKELQKPSI